GNETQRKVSPLHRKLWLCITVDQCRNGRLLDHKMRPSNIWSQSSMIMALSSDFPGVGMLFIFAGYYNKRPIKNIKVQNLLLYVFGMAFSVVAIVIQISMPSQIMLVSESSLLLGCCIIIPLCRIFSGIKGVVSVVMKYAENTVKTSVALLLTTVVSVYLFNFHVSLAFLLGSSKLTAFASVNTINLTFSHKIA
ncbi:unnamed protein product, partial [Brassica rapa]